MFSSEFVHILEIISNFVVKQMNADEAARKVKESLEAESNLERWRKNFDKETKDFIARAEALIQQAVSERKTHCVLPISQDLLWSENRKAYWEIINHFKAKGFWFWSGGGGSGYEFSEVTLWICWGERPQKSKHLDNPIPDIPSYVTIEAYILPIVCGIILIGLFISTVRDCSLWKESGKTEIVREKLAISNR